jgi:hypothetical protein
LVKAIQAVTAITAQARVIPIQVLNLQELLMQAVPVAALDLEELADIQIGFAVTGDKV